MFANDSKKIGLLGRATKIKVRPNLKNSILPFKSWWRPCFRVAHDKTLQEICPFIDKFEVKKSLVKKEEEHIMKIFLSLMVSFVKYTKCKKSSNLKYKKKLYLFLSGLMYSTIAINRITILSMTIALPNLIYQFDIIWVLYFTVWSTDVHCS